MKLTARVMRYAHGPQFGLVGPNGRLRLSLVDAGSGISSDLVTQIFDQLAERIGTIEVDMEIDNAG
jgi:hypothetical protein